MYLLHIAKIIKLFLKIVLLENNSFHVLMYMTCCLTCNINHCTELRGAKGRRFYGEGCQFVGRKCRL